MYRYVWEVIKVRINLFNKTAVVLDKKMSFMDYLDSMGSKGWKLKKIKDLQSRFPKDSMLPKGLVIDVDRELIWIKR